MATTLGLTLFDSAANIVASETSNFNANLFYIGLPFVSSDSLSFNLSLLPKQRIIILTGRFRGTAAEQLAFINEIETQSDDSSQSQKTYTNAIGKVYYTRINTFTYTLSEFAPNHTDWTMELYSESN